MDTETLARALACLDPLTPRPANQIGCMLWPDRQFNTQQAAGAAARKVLRQLERMGRAAQVRGGWIAIGATR